jgi:ATP-dependent DNA helicase RecG
MQIGRFKSETTIIDNLSLNTDILSEIETIIEFIKKHLMVEFIITGKPDREERYDYPPEALREIVINMIVHRDYRDSGDSIIKIFDDKIEFFNPGGLFADITIEKLKSGDYVSRTRNKLLANMLKEYGLIEKYGSGIKRVRNSCKEHGIGEPVFENFQHGFKVTVFKEKLNGGINGGIKSVLDFIRVNPGVKGGMIAKGLNLPQRTVERVLKRLKDEGVIEFIGSKKSGGYFVK